MTVRMALGVSAIHLNAGHVGGYGGSLVLQPASTRMLEVVKAAGGVAEGRRRAYGCRRATTKSRW
jgi:hypothetical protein